MPDNFHKYFSSNQKGFMYVNFIMTDFVEKFANFVEIYVSSQKIGAEPPQMPLFDSNDS